MRILVLLVVVLAAPGRATGQPSPSIQEVLLRATPTVAVVLAELAAEVKATCRPGYVRTAMPSPFRETGTAWVVNPTGWLLTTAQVVATAHSPPSHLVRQQAEAGVRAACLPVLLEARGLTPGERPDVEDQIARRLAASVVSGARVELKPSVWVVLSNGFRLAARIAKYSPPVAGQAMAGRDLALLRVDAADLPSLTLARSTRPQIGDRVYVIGFPEVIMTHELLRSSATIEPSVTTGAISGFKQDINDQPLIQTDAAAAAGASGSPAVNGQGAVLGMLSLVGSDQKDVVQGFNFVLPASAIREFLGGSGVALDEPSRFNAAWHAGLAGYFSGRHARAAPHLREANRLMPELPDVRRISADNAMRAEAEPWLPWRRVGVAMVIAGALGFLGLWVTGRVRNRFRVTPTEVARLIDVAPDPPVILDVRDATAYAKSPLRIPRSLHLPLDRLSDGQPVLLDTTRSVVAYCT